MTLSEFGLPDVTDEEWATSLTGCVRNDDGAFPFCDAHDEDGNPPWERCRWHITAEALEQARQEGRIDGARAVPRESTFRERYELLRKVERVQAFVDGFAERGGGKITAGDELWIMSIRRELDGKP